MATRVAPAASSSSAAASRLSIPEGSSCFSSSSSGAAGAGSAASSSSGCCSGCAAGSASASGASGTPRHSSLQGGKEAGRVAALIRAAHVLPTKARKAGQPPQGCPPGATLRARSRLFVSGCAPSNPRTHCPADSSSRCISSTSCGSVLTSGDAGASLAAAGGCGGATCCAQKGRGHLAVGRGGDGCKCKSGNAACAAARRVSGRLFLPCQRTCTSAMAAGACIQGLSCKAASPARWGGRRPAAVAPRARVRGRCGAALDRQQRRGEKDERGGRLEGDGRDAPASGTLARGSPATVVAGQLQCAPAPAAAPQQTCTSGRAGFAPRGALVYAAT